MGKFKVEWLAESEILSKVKDELHALVFNRLVQGQAYTGDGLLVDSGVLDATAEESAAVAPLEVAGIRFKSSETSSA